MKFSISLFVISILSACTLLDSKPEVKRCEQQIRSKLENPESYKRTEQASLSLGERWQVGVAFSYITGNGTRVEDGWQTCDFPIVNGKPDTSKFLSLESSLDTKPD